MDLPNIDRGRGSRPIALWGPARGKSVVGAMSAVIAFHAICPKMSFPRRPATPVSSLQFLGDQVKKIREKFGGRPRQCPASGSVKL